MNPPQKRWSISPGTRKSGPPAGVRPKRGAHRRASAGVQWLKEWFKRLKWVSSVRWLDSGWGAWTFIGISPSFTLKGASRGGSDIWLRASCQRFSGHVHRWRALNVHTGLAAGIKYCISSDQGNRRIPMRKWKTLQGRGMSETPHLVYCQQDQPG